MWSLICDALAEHIANLSEILRGYGVSGQLVTMDDIMLPRQSLIL